MASSVEQVLKDIGPGISSRITAKLMEGGMTAAAARQQISRAKAMIEKWLKKVDVIHAVLKVDKRFKTAKFGFEYWTCGTFSVFSNRWKSVRHATSNTSKPEGFPALVTTILVIDM